MSYDPLPGLLRSFNLTTMAGLCAATMKSAEADHWGYPASSCCISASRKLKNAGNGAWPGCSNSRACRMAKA